MCERIGAMPGAAADEDHLVVGVAREELAEGTYFRDLVAL